MLLIADSGSTKTDWCLIHESKLIKYETEGFNPYQVDANYISSSLSKVFIQPEINQQVHSVFFYGSGCFPERVPVIISSLQPLFMNATISVELDLLAAARALLKTQAGFAAILGTGTNTCIYDGKKITENIDSLGYVLGDEGSGTALGKKLLGDYIRGYMPQTIQRKFFEQYRLTKDDIFQKIYQQPLANRFCAGFAPFISEHIIIPYFSQLVEDCFNDFFKNLVSNYQGYNQYSFNCVGSIAENFRDQLVSVADSYGMKTEVIAKSPMNGLVGYHINQYAGIEGSK